MFSKYYQIINNDLVQLEAKRVNVYNFTNMGYLVFTSFDFKKTKHYKGISRSTPLNPESWHIQNQRHIQNRRHNQNLVKHLQ